jgi:RNA polymerase-binding protein
MRTVKNGTMQGTRAGGGPAGEPYGGGYTVTKVVVNYYCADGHWTTVPFIWTATTPPLWECRVCSQPAGTDPLDPPAKVATYAEKKTHLGRVKSRRSPAEGDVLMAESLARRDHPERFNVPAAPRTAR